MKKGEVLFLLIILTIASFFRFWKLSIIPPGLYPDEAINGNEAITLSGRVFYPENNGREGLFVNLISLSFAIFDPSIWAMRFVSAIIGVLTVLGLYLLTKELINQAMDNKKQETRIALLASFFLAVSFWHINFSRIVFRAILLPFILVFAFYFLFRGFRTQKNHHFIISGIFLGLGFYTYISYRFVVLLMGIVLFSWYFIYKKQGSGKWFLLFAVCCLLFTVLVALPIGIYFLKNPGDFLGRATPISVFVTENPLKEFGKSLVLHLALFNFYGDPNWRHNFSGSPQLFWPIGIFFLVGMGLSIKKIVEALRKKDCLLFAVHCFLLSWFFIMLLPGVLTYEGVPHALRTIGVIPSVYIFAALGGNYLYDWLNNKINNKRLIFVFCSLFFVLLTFTQLYKYFFCWGQHPEVANAFSKDYVDLGNYLNSLPQDVQKYVIVNRSGVPVPWPDGLPMPAQTPMFIERTKFGKTNSSYLLPDRLNEIKIDERKTIILLVAFDEGLLWELKARFPQGEIRNEKGIWVYKINL